MLAILDRDGVINQDSAAFVKSPDEWIALPGSLEAIARLSQAGWKVVIATNQSGLARGLFTMQSLQAMHQKMRVELAKLGGHVDSIFICPHGPDDGCGCRKPLPGLFQSILHRYKVSPQQCRAVGDSLRDIQAANAVGCPSWLVRTGNGEKAIASGALPDHCRIQTNLAAVVDEWLSE